MAVPTRTNRPVCTLGREEPDGEGERVVLQRISSTRDTLEVPVPSVPSPASVQACRTGAVPLLALGCLLLSLLGLGFSRSVDPTADTTAEPVATVSRDLPARYAHHRGPAGAGGDRQLLGHDTAGRGLVTEVFGDLAAARDVAVLVGGVGTDLATFDTGTLRTGARALAAVSPASAVVAWADYVSPASIGPSAAGPGLARAGGRRLGVFLDSLRENAPATHVVLVCHSYGSAVCAAALAGEDAHGVDDVVDLASPGVGEGRLPAGVRRWTATGPADPIRLVPHVRIGGFGLGVDPAGTPGARRLPVPPGGDHDDYLATGSPTLAAVAAVLSA